MKTKFKTISWMVVLIITSTLFNAKGQNLKEDNITYTANGVTLNGFVTYNENIKGKRPAVLVVHEWWGLNDYPKMRKRVGKIRVYSDGCGYVRQWQNRKQSWRSKRNGHAVLH